MAIPLFTVGTPYQELPIETQSPSLIGAEAGAKIAASRPGALEALASGFTGAVQNYSKLADEQSQREYRDTQTALSKLKLEQEQADQQNQLELQQKRDDEEKAKLAQDAQARQQLQNVNDAMQTQDPQTIKQAMIQNPLAMMNEQARKAALPWAVKAMSDTELDTALGKTDSSVSDWQKYIMRNAAKVQFDNQRLTDAVSQEPVFTRMAALHPQMYPNALAAARDTEMYPEGALTFNKDGTYKTNPDGSALIDEAYKQNPIDKGTMVAVSKSTHVVTDRSVSGSFKDEKTAPGLHQAFIRSDKEIPYVSPPGSATAINATVKPVVHTEMVRRGRASDTTAQPQTGQTVVAPSAGPGPNAPNAMQSIPQADPNAPVDRLTQTTVPSPTVHLNQPTLSIPVYNQVIAAIPLGSRQKIATNPQALAAISKTMGFNEDIAKLHASKLQEAVDADVKGDPDALQKKVGYISAVLGSNYDALSAKHDPTMPTQADVDEHNRLVDNQQKIITYRNSQSLLSKTVYAPSASDMGLSSSDSIDAAMNVSPPYKVKDAKELYINKKLEVLLSRLSLVTNQAEQEADKQFAATAGTQANKIALRSYAAQKAPI